MRRRVRRRNEEGLFLGGNFGSLNFLDFFFFLLGILFLLLQHGRHNGIKSSFDKVNLFSLVEEAVVENRGARGVNHFKLRLLHVGVKLIGVIFPR